MEHGYCIVLFALGVTITGIVCHYGGKRAMAHYIIKTYRADKLAVELWLAKGAAKQIKSENEDS